MTYTIMLSTKIGREHFKNFKKIGVKYDIQWGENFSYYR